MFKKIAIIFLIILGFSVELFAYKGDKVRIAVLQDASSAYIKVKGSFEIYDLISGKLIYRGKNLQNQLIRGSPSKIAFLKIDSNSARIKIKPLRKGLVYINNRPFRESVNLIRKENGNILIVNEINIEDYIKGVLSHEVAPWWPHEALRAQAIVARTYALYHLRFTALKDFDLTSDIYSQVYGGKAAERWRTNRAVDLTRGLILTFKDDLFATYYHATCGGHTEDAKNLWKVEIAPLVGVECKFCAGSPHYRWEANLTLDELKSRLNNKGFQVSDITGIEIIDHNTSGRITQLEIKSQANSLIVSAKDFRQALGPNLIRSTNFILKIISGYVYFEGLGWGHGVGLCQWGAYFMAKKGYKYEQILMYYFPQSKIVLSY